MKRYRYTLAASVAFIGQFGIGTMAQAQSAATDGGGIQDIVVTAQKREQSVNDVGLSITSVDSSVIERRGISTSQDLVKVVPGLSVADAGNGATVVYSLRGVGFNSSNLGATSAVAVYVDEIPLPYPIMTQGVGLDLQRVEAYKGPQGTLFGQNSTGGAVNYIANKPTDEFSGGAEASYGRFDAWSTKGFVSGPVSDKVKFRIAASHEGGGAWQKSYTRDDSLGDRDRTAARLLIDWAATDAANVTFGLNAWSDRSESQALQLVRYAPLLPPGLPEVAAYPTAPHNPRAADWDAPTAQPGSNKKFEYDSKFVQPFLRADIDFAENMKLTSISTYSKYDTDSLIDPDGTSFEIGEIGQIGKIDDFSQEVRLSGDTDRLHWVVGANYQKNTIDEHLDILIHDLSNVQNIGGSGFGAILSPVTTQQKTEAKAVFGNAEFEFNNQWSAVAGIRYTKTEIKFAGCNLDSGPPIPNEPQPGVTASLRGFFNILYGALTGNVGANPIGEGECITLDNVSRNGAPPTFLPTDSAQTLDEDNVSWNFTLNYKPVDDVLLYSRVAKGYKSGSFPTIGASTAVQFNPATQESLLAYEAGFKATTWRHRLQIDGAGFYYDYKNKQLSNFVPDLVFGPLVAIVNVPKSRVYGAELAATVMPVTGLSVTGAVTYIDTKIKEFTGFDVNGVAADLAGERFNLSPKWSGSFDVNYEFPIAPEMRAFVGTGLTYRSKTSGVIGSTSSDYDIDAYTTVDAQAGIESEQGWRLQVWGKNIFNEYYWSNVNRISDTIVRAAGMPATYGVTVGVKF